MSRKKSGRVSSARTISPINADVYVSVYCVGVDSPHEKWRIGTLYPNTEAGETRWGSIRGQYLDASAGIAIPIAGSVSQYLDANNDWVESGGNPWGFGGARVRWQFRCSQCRLSKPVADPAALFPALTQIAASGIREIELRHIVSTRR